MKTKADHVVVDATRKGVFLCLHCGAEYDPGYPVDLDMWTAMGKTFAKRHARCKPSPAGAEKAKPPSETVPQGISWQEWWKSRDAGLSSKTICSVMTDRYFEAPMPPQDPDDFGRCHRLMERFPEWRDRLPEVAAKYPEWTGLVREWPRLTALYVRDFPTGQSADLFEEMQRLIREAP